MHVNEADRKLWLAWRHQRDQEAFAALVRPHLAFLADFARRRGLSAADADDVVQVALADLAAEQSDRPVAVGLRPWLGRSIVLKSKMARRAAGRRARHEQAAPPPALASGDPVADRDLVEACLRDLPEPQREAVVLRYLHDLEYEEMAYVTGATVNACRLRVHKGIARMRGRVGSRVGALVAMLPLLAGRSEAALVKGALVKSAAVPLLLAGGLLAVKKTIAAVVVLGAVAGSFYLLGRGTNDARPERADAPPARATLPDRPETPSEPLAKKEEGESELTPPTTSRHSVDDMIRMVQSGNKKGWIAFAARAKYLADSRRVQWKIIDADTIEAPDPTGFKLQGESARSLLPFVARRPHVVYYLELRDFELDDATLGKLAHLTQLVTLDLSRTRITDAGLVHLLGMTDLRRLYVADTAITDEGLRTIGRLTSLRALSIRDTAVTDEGLAHLKNLVNLEYIRFDARAVTENALEHIAHLPLRHLWLADIDMSEAGLQRVAAMSHVRELRLEKFDSLRGLGGARSLESLNLSDAKIGSGELAHIGSLAGLKALDLEESSIDTEDIRYLATLGALESLNLKEVDLDGDALVHFKGLTQLKQLRLDGNKITNESLRHLAHLTGLERLDIDENPITDAGLKHLYGLTGLRHLDLKDTKVTAKGIEELRKALPNCNVRMP